MQTRCCFAAIRRIQVLSAIRLPFFSEVYTYSAVWRMFALFTSMLFVMLADVFQPSLAVFLVILAAVIAVGIVLRRSH